MNQKLLKPVEWVRHIRACVVLDGIEMFVRVIQALQIVIEGAQDFASQVKSGPVPPGERTAILHVVVPRAQDQMPRVLQGCIGFQCRTRVVEPCL
jgi:hypothetical protein